jgi:hypothetical protein
MGNVLTQILAEAEESFDADAHVRSCLGMPDPQPYEDRYTQYLRCRVATDALQLLARERGPLRFQVTLWDCDLENETSAALFRALSPEGRVGVKMLDGQRPSWLAESVDDVVPFLEYAPQRATGRTTITVSIAGCDVASVLFYDWTAEQFTIAEASAVLRDTVRRCATSRGLEILEGREFGHDFLRETKERALLALEWATAGGGRLPIAPYIF